MIADLQTLSRDLGRNTAHAGDLIEGAFFFAMRVCEFAHVRKRGKTRPLILGNIAFRDRKKRKILQTDEKLEEKAHYVTITFVDQKNGRKMEKRTQRATKEDICPARAWARVCRRVRETVTGASDQTLAYLVGDERGGGNNHQVSSDQIVRIIRTACRVFGDEKGYGIKPNDLGSHSIRSGAAMSMFMMDHLVEKIMILGRWSSDAFMVYIRPQVMEWTNIMLKDMAKAGSFTDLGLSGREERRPPTLDTSVVGEFFPRVRTRQRRV
jgi:hypothetical protein